MYKLAKTEGSPCPRRRTPMLLVGVFTAGDVLIAVAPACWLTLVGRVVAAFVLGASSGIAVIVDAELVAPEISQSANPWHGGRRLPFPGRRRRG